MKDRPRGFTRLTILSALVVASSLGVATGPAAVTNAAGQGTPTLYVAPTGRDSTSCSAAAPCASFGRAYRIAAPGDVVQVAGGDYPAQMLPSDPSKTSSADVVFQPAAGASVSVRAFSAGDNNSGVGAKHFELRDMKVAGVLRLVRGAEDVTLRNVDAGDLVLTSARNVSVYGGDYGPWVNGVSHINACGVPGCFPSENVVIDGALFHDFTISDPANHSECLMIWPGKQVMIRNSTFRNCTDFDVLVKPYNTGLVGLPGQITFENNFFDSPMPGNTATSSCNPGCPRGGNAIAITDGSGEAWNGVAIRYNSSLGGILVDPAVTGVSVVGNVAQKSQRTSCQGNVTFSYNVWSATRCSPTDKVAPLATVFNDPSSAVFDLHLRPGSPAIGAGDPQSAPAKDMAGRLRPVGFASDAGAWQREPALVVPGHAIGTAKIGAPNAAILAFYGNPRHKTKTKLASGTPVDVASYNVRGGRLRVTYRRNKVVQISTTSSYYRTLAGLGPSSKLRPRPGEKGVCRAVGGKVGKARLYVRPTSSRTPVVAELYVTARGVVPACAVVKKT